MMIPETIRIRSHELGLEFKHDEFVGIKPAGHYRRWPFSARRITVVSTRDALFRHPQLDLIVRSGALDGLARIVDLADHERALVWIDKRFAYVLQPGLHVLWTTQRAVEVEIVDVRAGFFAHAQADVIVTQFGGLLHEVQVGDGMVGALMRNGRIEDILEPGRYLLWRVVRGLGIEVVDLREQVLDVTGQDIMTSDRVTLRMNAVVTTRITDVRTAAMVSGDPAQALYRSVQLALRGSVGTRTLDQLLADKDALAGELRHGIRARAGELGMAVGDVGIRDIILPGEMKVLLNKVTEARTAAEANLITRREETAAMRSQLNAAKMLQDHPTLMRLRELEILERVAEKSSLQVVLGEQGLADRITKLI